MKPFAANPVASYGLAAVLALALHGAALALALVNWDLGLPRNVTELRPYYLEAAVVGENPVAAEKARRAAAALALQRRREAERLASEAALREREAAWEKEKQALAEAQRQEAEARKREAERREAEARAAAALTAAQGADDAEQDEAQRAAELARAVAAEQGRRKAVTDDEKALAYAAQIQADIIQQWSRPPSARNGMQAVLGVTLIPTGEVAQVRLLESSGNDAFDRSAEAAVRKAGQFDVPPDLGGFERNFREFTVIFRPEDLRL